MHTPHHPTRLATIAAAALALAAGPAIVNAQATPVADAAAPSAPSFYPGTESTATYPLANGTLTVHAGMPALAPGFGPPPTFASLDANHDGRISEAEARAYPPLDNDFLYASGGGTSISQARYSRWVNTRD